MMSDMTADTLIILLPGALMTPQHFRDAGFDAALAQRAPNVDLHLAAIDANQMDASACVDIICTDIVSPARRQGYRRIVLGGISLGGTTALHYAQRYGDTEHRVDGLCLLAPYPGSRLTTAAIRRSGARAWQAATTQTQDSELQLWRWLIESCPKQSRRGSLQLPVFFGYGCEDRFADGIALLAEMLPASHVEVLPGGHDWPTWRRLWERFIVSVSSFAHSAA